MSDFFVSEDVAEIRQFKNREVTAPALHQVWDGVLTDDMLSSEGNAFAGEYFDPSTGPCVTEYARLLADGLDTPYHVADSWENHERLKRQLDERLAEWRSRKA